MLDESRRIDESAQTGSLGLKVGKQKFNLNLQSQGVPTGERVLREIEPEKIPFERMADLGMRDKMYARLQGKAGRQRKHRVW